MLYDLGAHRVQTVGDDFFVAPNAAVIGRVYLGRDASVWFNAVLRGDGNDIRLGDRSNVQDTAVLHVDHDAPCTVGNDVTIGHGATVHGCTVGDHSLIGMGAILLNGARIGAHSIVGAGALVTEGKSFPDHSLIVGAPGRAVRTLDEKAAAQIAAGADIYVRRWRNYGKALKRID